MIHVLLYVIVTAQFLLLMWFVSFQLQWLLVSQIFLLLLDLFPVFEIICINCIGTCTGVKAYWRFNIINFC